MRILLALLLLFEGCSTYSRSEYLGSTSGYYHTQTIQGKRLAVVEGLSLDLGAGLRYSSELDRPAPVTRTGALVDINNVRMLLYTDFIFPHYNNLEVVGYASVEIEW